MRPSAPAFFEPLEPRRLLATIEWDGGGDGASWHDAENWQGDVLPGAADSVIINRGPANPTIVFSAGNTTIHDLRARENLTISGGVLTVSETSWMAGVLTVTGGALRVGNAWNQFGSGALSGGQIDGAGIFALRGTMDWTGGAIGSASSAAGRFQVLGTLNLGGDVDLNSLLVNNGTLLWTGGVVSMEGRLVNLAGRTFSPFDGAEVAGGTGAVLENRGALVLPGDFTVSAAFFQSAAGTTNLNAGALSLKRGGNIDGTLTTAAGSEVRSDADTLPVALSILPGAAVTLGGTLAVAGGRLAVKPAGLVLGALAITGGSLTLPGDITIERLTWSDGVIGGAGEVTISGTMTWSGGKLVASDADLVIDSGAELVVPMGSGTISIRRPVRVFGVMSWEGGFVTTTREVLIDGAGSFHADAAACSFTMSGAAGGLTVLGEFTAAPPSGAVTFVAAAPAPGLVLDSGATVHAGQVRLFGNTAMSGLFSVDSGAVLALSVLDGGPTIAPGAVFEGQGTLQVESAPVDAPVVLRGTIQTGVLEIAGAADLDEATLAPAGTLLSGGTIVGSSDYIIDESFTWAGGSFAGAGRTIVPQGVSLTLNISTLHRVQRTFINRGSVLLFRGFLWVDGGGEFRGEAGSTFTINNTSGGAEVRAWQDGTFRVLPGAVMNANTGTISGSSTGAVELLGAFHKTGSAAFNIVAESVRTAGTFAVDQGSVLIRYGTHDAAFTVATGAALRAAGVGLNQPTFTAKSSVIGLGSLVCGNARFDGVIDVGTLRLQGDQNGPPRVLTLGGATKKRAAEADVDWGVLSLEEDVLLEVTGNLLLISGTVQMRVASVAEFSRVDVGGVLTIAEPPAVALQVFLLETFAPGAGQSLSLFTHGAASGAFSSLELVPLPLGVTPDLAYLPAAIVLSFVPF